MLLYLLKVLDGAWVLALITALIFYPQKVYGKGARLGAPFMVSLFLGIIVAFLYALFKRNTGWVVREYYDIIILWPLMALCISFLIMFWVSAAKALRADLGSLFLLALRIVAAAIFALVLMRVLPDLFILPLDFDVGMNSVFNMEYLMRVTGYATALVLLFLLFLAVRFLMTRLGARVSKVLVTLCFLVIMVYFFIDMVRIMYVRRMLPSYDWIADLVIFFMGKTNLFLFLELSLLAICALYCFFRSVVDKPVGDNPAKRRKSKYSLILKRRAAVFLLIVAALIFFSGESLRALHERGPYISEPEPVSASDGLIALPLDIVGDGNLHRYVFMTQSGTAVRFIVIKKSANAYGVGLDACDICGATGYYQRGDQVICKLCDVVMNKTTIGFPGGCNPVPLPFAIKDGALTVKASDLESETRRFM
jgi:uncharacterized membrane protein